MINSALNFLLTRAHAVEVGVDIPGTSGNNFSYETYICAFYRYSLPVGFGLTWGIIIIAGYLYMTSAGNDSRFTIAKGLLTNAIIGFGMLIIIRLILNVLSIEEFKSCYETIK